MVIDFITIFTDKLEESIEFYTNVLGLSIMKDVEALGDIRLVFLTDGHGVDIELIDHGAPVLKPANCPVALTIKVDNIYETEKMVDEKELIKSFGPSTMPSGVKLLHVPDPNGVTINFVELPQ